MGAGPGGATPEQFIVAAQKATNQLKALLANAAPLLASEGTSAGAQSSGSATDALLSDITNSLSQALATLQLGPLDSQPPAAQPGQSSSCGGGRRSTPRRTAQRVRMDGACRIVLQNEPQDSDKWRKYGQKEILGARFPRSYFKCGRNSSCPARKHVQQTDADPSKLELTYLEAHTCDDDPPPPSSTHLVPDTMISSSTQGSTARHVPAAVPSSAQPRHIGQPLSSPMITGPMTMAGSNVPRTTGDHLVPSPSEPVAAAVPAALSSTTAKYDHVVPDDHTTFTPWIEEEQAEVMFLVPSPACSLSELLSAEVAKVELHGLPVRMDRDVPCDGSEHNTVSDFAVPEL